MAQREEYGHIYRAGQRRAGQGCTQKFKSGAGSEEATDPSRTCHLWKAPGCAYCVSSSPLMTTYADGSNEVLNSRDRHEHT